MEDNMDKVLEFLKAARTFYFGTVNGDQPEVRPFGFFMEYEGKLYFGMGQHKNAYKQLQNHPRFVVCAVNGTDWIRLRAEAGFEASEAAYKRAFETNPFLSSIYNDKSGLKFVLVEAKNAEVEFCNMMGPVETIKL